MVDCKIYNSSTRGKSIQNQSTTPFGRCGLTLDWFTTREIVIDFAIHQLLGPLISTIFWWNARLTFGSNKEIFTNKTFYMNCTKKTRRIFFSIYSYFELIFLFFQMPFFWRLKKLQIKRRAKISALLKEQLRIKNVI